jgi:hypothetical protein
MTYCVVNRRSLAYKCLSIKSFQRWCSANVYAQCLKELEKRFFVFFKKLLTDAKLCSKIWPMGSSMTIREAIQKELQKRRWSYYRLVKELEGKIPARTVYAYLGGECDLVSDRVSIILQALGLRITHYKRKTGQRPRR